MGLETMKDLFSMCAMECKSLDKIYYKETV